MLTYRLHGQLQMLREEGDRLLVGTKEVEMYIFYVNAWLAAVQDVLNYALQQDSELLAQFKKIELGYYDDSYGPTREDLVRAVRRANYIIDRALEILIESWSGQRDSETHKLMRGSLEREIMDIVREKFFSWWWFRVPIFVLGVTALFAIFGVWQIQNYRVDLRDLATAAVVRAKEDISAQTADIESTLVAYGGTEKKRITYAVDDLKPTVDSLERRIGGLEKRVPPLERGVDAISVTDLGSLEEAAIVLNQSTVVILITIVASILALALSILSLTRSLGPK